MELEVEIVVSEDSGGGQLSMKPITDPLSSIRLSFDRWALFLLDLHISRYELTTGR